MLGVELTKGTVEGDESFKDFNSNALNIPKKISISIIFLKCKNCKVFGGKRNRSDFTIDYIKFPFLSSRARSFKKKGARIRRK